MKDTIKNTGRRTIAKVFDAVVTTILTIAAMIGMAIIGMAFYCQPWEVGL